MSNNQLIANGQPVIPTALTNLTAACLLAGAIAIWMQAFSGDPAYPKVPPGPIIFVLIAGFIVLAARWWWTPALGAVISLMTTVGWFVRLQPEMLRLTHPSAVGKFAAGIFIGTLLQIVMLLITDVSGIAATVQNYRLSRDREGPSSFSSLP